MRSFCHLWIALFISAGCIVPLDGAESDPSDSSGGGDGVGDEASDDVENTAQPIIGGTSVPAGTRGVVLVNGCSGTLLTNRWVLTATHCFYDPNVPANPASITVTFGNQSRTADQILFHPTVYFDPLEYIDATLVRVSQPFTIAGSTTGYQ